MSTVQYIFVSPIKPIISSSQLHLLIYYCFSSETYSSDYFLCIEPYPIWNFITDFLYLVHICFVDWDCLIETGSFILLSLALDSQSFCLCLLSVGITGARHHAYFYLCSGCNAGPHAYIVSTLLADPSARPSPLHGIPSFLVVSFETDYSFIFIFRFF